MHEYVAEFVRGRTDDQLWETAAQAQLNQRTVWCEPAGGAVGPRAGDLWHEHHRHPGSRAGLAVVCDRCARSGVTVVFVPEIAGARAYGATRWLAPNRPLVQLSLRGRTDDQLWETAAHELGHVLMHDRRAVFIDTGEDEPDTAEATADAREHEATAFARELLIPPAAQTRLLSLRRVEDVLGFAADVGVAVSIAAARLQRHGIWSPRQAGRLKRRIEDRDLPDLAAARSAPDDASRRASRPHPGQRGD